MSVQAMAWALDVRDLSPSEKLVLIVLGNFADAAGSAWPSQKTLADMTCLTDRTIRSALASLEEKGLIVRTQRVREDGSRRSDMIALVMTERPSVQPETPSEDPEILSGGAEIISGGVRKSFPGGAETVSGHDPSLDPSVRTITPPTPPEPGGRRGQRLPDDWQPSPTDRDKARAEGLTEPEIDRAATEFCNYWHSRPGAGGCKLDWSKTWHNWVIRDGRRGRGGGAGMASRPAQPGAGRQGPVDFAAIVARRRGYG